ncbi:MAG: hypothetical protein PHY34_02750 [Patescibacteria group bacterium]|nr:hypothetical protein [Patescibacteria group bacterium]MDD5715439.1 hypothetical protein [Patescibacteria group bacterium]
MKQLRGKFSRITREALLCVALVIGIGVAFGARVALAEWIEPKAPPPAGVFYQPLTAGAEDQAKSGYLKIDPDYGITEESSLIFTSEKPLDVEGPGAKFSTEYTYADTLRVDGDTLYANSVQSWVGIGTDVWTPNTKLKVDGGTVEVAGATDVPVQAISSSGSGIVGDAGMAADAGVYGYRESADGWAVYGVSDANVGVRGESASGYGIYAVTEAADAAAVYGKNKPNGWAGYFDGMLGAGTDVVSKRFAPSAIQYSAVPFTAGQMSGPFYTSVDTGDYGRAVFDGTYIWVNTDYYGTMGANRSKNLFKLRASDGVEVASYSVGGTHPRLYGMAFDGKDIWAGTEDGYLIRVSTSGETLESVQVSAAAGTYYVYSVGVATLNAHKYIFAAVQGGGVGSIVRVDAENTADRITYTLPDDGDTPRAFAFDGEYMWVGVHNYDPPGHRVIRLWAEDPNTPDPEHQARTWAANSMYPDAMTFDGEYIWVSGWNTQRLTRLWAENPDDPDHPRLDLRLGTEYHGHEPKGIVYTGSNLWLVTLNDTSVAGATNGTVLRLSPDIRSGLCTRIDNGQCRTDADCVAAHGAGWSCYAGFCNTTGNGPTQSCHNDIDCTSISNDWQCVLRDTDFLGKTVTTNFHPWRALFDGTYIWSTNASDSGTSVIRIYAGTGSAFTSTSSVVNLKDNIGTCSGGSPYEECMYSANCPSGQTCNVDSLNSAVQKGNIKITGTADINTQAVCFYNNMYFYSRPCEAASDCQNLLGQSSWDGTCARSGHVSVGADLKVANNEWGSESSVNVSGTGSFNCQTGTFIKGIILDSSSKIQSFSCAEL